jgi:serine/threonine-protein kinase RsbW
VSEKTPRVRLELDSRPESVTLVRGMLAGVGETLRLDAELLDDVKTAVSEACNNVVMHAYGDAIGLLDVEFEIGPEELQIWVRDEGEGIRGVAAPTDRMGVGLAVISALADRATFTSPREGGTEVQMAFFADTAAASLPTAVAMDGDRWSDGLDGDVVVHLTPNALLAGVLGRIARALGARARFSVDRLSDFYPVADAIAAHAQAAAATERIAFAIAAGERRLELTLGPFDKGTGARLTSRSNGAESTSPLALLADEVSAQPHGDAELLRVVLADPRPA